MRLSVRVFEKFSEDIVRRKGILVACGLLAGTVSMHAGVASAMDVDGIAFTRCEVYVQGDPERTRDCKAAADAVCGGKPYCELPIGGNLSGGAYLAEWSKVIVEYNCGPVHRINGPHHQNDHATMTLYCAGR